MKKVILGIASACAVFAVNPARAACLTDEEIDAAVGNQVRAKAMFITAPQLVGRPLCSGITLARRIQLMREAAFPEERTERETALAEQRRLQEADDAADAMFSETDTMTSVADESAAYIDPDAPACDECDADAAMNSPNPVSPKAHRTAHKHHKKRH